MPRSPSSLAPLCLALGALAACASAPSAPRICEGACAAGSVCVVSRCRAEGDTVAPVESRRLLLTPTDSAVIASGASSRVDAAAGSTLASPETVALGRDADGLVEILLRFDATWRDDAGVSAAFLLLTPLEGVAPAATPATFETARVLEPWSSATASWGRQPRLSRTEAAGTLRPRRGAPLRIDVTSLVRAWSARAASDHGIALLVSGGDAVGTALAMGVSGGAGPRLEVYVQ